jgi:uncharacterized protein YxjI
MITPSFYVGQRVVCINDDFTILLAQDPRITVPVKGQEYTIRKNFQLLNAVGVTLEEIDNTHAIPKGRKLEPNFNQNRFALVQPVKVTEEEEVGELQAV